MGIQDSLRSAKGGEYREVMWMPKELMEHIKAERASQPEEKKSVRR
jgi:CO dehydrogenase/acetyl-CoA synthase beta subunit